MRSELAGKVKVGKVISNDGVTLKYLERGSGTPLILIPGWSQTAEQFYQQILTLSQSYHVYAIDHRGHGESAKVDYGYSISRLAADLNDFIMQKDLRDIEIVAHSMGVSVTWSYIEQFTSARLSRLVLLDQPACLLQDPSFTDQEKLDFGAIFPPQQSYDIVHGLQGEGGIDLTKGLVSGMFTAKYSADEVRWVIEQNLKLPRQHAATLLLDHITRDWRQVVARIKIPTTIVSAEQSLFPAASGTYLARTMPHAKQVVVAAADGGSHMMFAENPELVNNLILSRKKTTEKAA